MLQQLDLESAQRSCPFPPQPQAIPRLDAPQPITIPSLLAAPSTPAIICNQWSNPAIGRWTLDYLAQTVGEQTVEVEYYPAGNRSRACTFLQMQLGEYLRKIQQDPDCRRHFYLAEYPLTKVAAKLQEEFSVPEILANTDGLRERLFLGIDSVTTAHYHRSRTQALLGQISGHKQVVLFPPSDLPKLRMNPWFSLRPNHSQLPFGEMRYEEIAKQEPTIRDCTPLMCEVASGELLFIPDHWVHYVVGNGESVSVTWFWDSNPPSGFLPGIRRDRCSHTAKTFMIGATKIASVLGLRSTLVKAASKVGVLSPDETEQVNGYLNRFGPNTPSKSVQQD